MPVLYANRAFSTLASGITNVATSLSVAAGQGARFPATTAPDYFYATLDDNAGNVEIVKVTARSTDTFTIVRAQDGTSALAFSAGAGVELRVVKAMLDDFKTDARAGYAPLSGAAFTGNVIVNASLGFGSSGSPSYGTSGQFLKSAGSAAVPTWAALTSGEVTTALGFTPLSSAPVSSVNGLTGAVSMTGLGDIGSYAVLMIATNTNVAANGTVAGSNLRHSWTPNFGPTTFTSGYSSYGANRRRAGTATYDGGGTSLSGTWRKVSTGDTYGSNVVTCGCNTTTYYNWMAALYVRIS